MDQLEIFKSGNEDAIKQLIEKFDILRFQVKNQDVDMTKEQQI